MKYRVIYADPPWRYSDKTLRFGENRRAGSSSVEAHYDSMPLEDIKLLSVPAEEDSDLVSKHLGKQRGVTNPQPNPPQTRNTK